MFYLLEEKYDNLDFQIILELLHKNKYLHEYEIVKQDFFYDINEEEKIQKTKENFADKYKYAVPIGSIQFVEKYLEIFNGVLKENPIEIPVCLRTDEFLKRKYSIVSGAELPRTGNYFIKNASKLKEFSYCGDLSIFLFDEMFENSRVNKDNIDTGNLKIYKDELYQVSEVIDILSEYRVYVINKKIESIELYNGSPLHLPDIQLITKANDIYSLQRDFPKSYSMDIMVTPRGTCITEVHAFTSLGLYSTLWGDNLLYAYKDAKDYIINFNTPPTKFSNFETFKMQKLEFSKENDILR